MRHPGTQAISTDRLLLRRFAEGDASELYTNVGADESVRAYIDWMPCATPEGARDFVAECLVSYASDPDFYSWVITFDGQIIGHIGVYDIDPEHATGELGYTVGASFTGRGFATEAARAVMGYMFREAGLSKLAAWAKTANIASCKVLEKIGMSQTKVEGDTAYYALSR